MDGTILFKLLRVLLVVLGAMTFIWGIYDMFGDGQQSSMGTKKIIGGIAFAAVSAFIMTWAITQVGQVQNEAGTTKTAVVTELSPTVPYLKVNIPII